MRNAPIFYSLVIWIDQPGAGKILLLRVMLGSLPLIPIEHILQYSPKRHMDGRNAGCDKHEDK